MKKFIIATLAVSVLATSVAPAMAAEGRAWYDAKERHDDRKGKDHKGNDRAWYDAKDRRDDRGKDRGPQFDHRPSVAHKGPPPHSNARKWRKGDRFDHRYAPRYVVIENPRHYHLHEAPRGYRWVRSGNDAVLVGITSGIVAAVVTSILIN